MQDRFKTIRKEFRLSQQQFGDRLGVTSGAISNIEKGNRGLSNQMKMTVCREFGISEKWLETGEGEMRLFPKGTMEDRMVTDFKLDPFAARAVVAYMQMSPGNKEAIKSFVAALNEKE